MRVVLRKIIRPKRDEVAEYKKRLHNEELHKLLFWLSNEEEGDGKAMWHVWGKR